MGSADRSDGEVVFLATVGVILLGVSLAVLGYGLAVGWWDWVFPVCIVAALLGAAAGGWLATARR